MLARHTKAMTSEAAIREALARIIASRTFEKSERARDLLNFVVGEELAGRGDRLKAFTIAVDVFGKDENFDAGSDPLVRVHAGRVRELLDQYYEEEGAGESLRIFIPKGGYVPVYEEVVPHPAAVRKQVETATLAGVLGNHARDTAESSLSDALREAIGTRSAAGLGTIAPRGVDGGATALAAETARNAATGLASHARQADRAGGSPGQGGLTPLILRHMKLYWLAIATIILMLAYVVFSLLGEQAAAPVNDARADLASRGHRGSITSALLPSVAVMVEDEMPASQMVGAELNSMLPKFDTIRLIAGEGNSSTTGYSFSVKSVDDTNATVRLINQATGEVLMSAGVTTSERSMIEAQMARIGSMTAGDGGAIYADIAANGSGNSLTRCIILNHEYFRDQLDTLHREAWDCFEEIARRGVKSPLVYAELATLMVESVADKRGYPANASLEQAQRLAEQALSRGPQSAHAHRAMGYVLARQGADAQALRWARSAHELNPHNLDFAASYGYALIFAGEYGEGTRLLGLAVDNAGQFQPWWVYGLACGLLMLDRAEEALAYADLVRSRSSMHYLALRLVLAQQAGKADQAEYLLAELQSRNTRFTANPEAFYRRANYPADLTSRLLEGLSGAGFAPGQQDR